MKKKILTILLALTMVVSMMSAMTVTSFAAATDSQIVVTKDIKTSISDITTYIKKLLNDQTTELKRYKPLIGVKNIQLSPDLKDDVQILTKAVKKNETNAIRAAVRDIYDDIDVAAKDVVEFTTTFDSTKPQEAVFSPVLIAKCKTATKNGDTVYVKAYANTPKEEEFDDLPSKLVSISSLLPDGIKLKKVQYGGKDVYFIEEYKNPEDPKEEDLILKPIDNEQLVDIINLQEEDPKHAPKLVQVYSFEMPNRMVTGYDFIAYTNNTLLDFFSKL